MDVPLFWKELARMTLLNILVDVKLCMGILEMNAFEKYSAVALLSAFNVSYRPQCFRSAALVVGYIDATYVIPVTRSLATLLHHHSCLAGLFLAHVPNVQHWRSPPVGARHKLTCRNMSCLLVVNLVCVLAWGMVGWWAAKAVRRTGQAVLVASSAPLTLVVEELRSLLRSCGPFGWRYEWPTSGIDRLLFSFQVQ
eukprot:77389-Pelagomonas_calceolata.AAC.1